MADYAPLVEAELARFERERQATTSRQMLAELRRALRGLRARLPQYELPKVEEPAPRPRERRRSPERRGAGGDAACG